MKRYIYLRGRYSVANPIKAKVVFARIRKPQACRHENLHFHINRAQVKDGMLGTFDQLLEIEVHCKDCYRPFLFVGLPKDFSFEWPTVSMDGMQASFPIKPI